MKFLLQSILLFLWLLATKPQAVAHACTDREAGSDKTEVHSYLRATSVIDRLGKEVDFTYGAITLVPSTISVAPSPSQTGGTSQTISILHNAQGLITDIWDPSKANTHFTYGTIQYQDNGTNYQEATLTGVQAADGAVTHYGYTFQTEADTTPLQPGQHPTPKLHLDLASITDPLGQSYAFAYLPDHTKFNYDAESGYYPQSGHPYNVSQVTLPDGSTSNFANDSLVKLQYANGVPSLTADSRRKTQVTDAVGHLTSYEWGNGQVFLTNDLSAYFSNPVTVPKVVYYTQLTVNYSGLGQEVYQFSLDAGAGGEQRAGSEREYDHVHLWRRVDGACGLQAILLAGRVQWVLRRPDKPDQCAGTNQELHLRSALAGDEFHG